MATDQVRQDDTRIVVRTGVVRVRAVDRPTPEDFLRYRLECLGAALRRGVVDQTQELSRRLKDEVLTGYFRTD